MREVSFAYIESEIEKIVDKKEGTNCLDALANAIKLISN